MSEPESFWKTLKKGADKLIDTINTKIEDDICIYEIKRYNSLIDNVGEMLMNIRKNPKHLSKTNALWDFKSVLSGKTTEEYDVKCQKLIEFIHNFNGRSIPTDDTHKPDFIEVTNRSNMKHADGYTLCDIDFRLNILPADYVIPYRPDLYQVENDKNK